MKLKLYALVLLIFPLTSTRAQDIRFFKGSFEAACQKAKEEHKLIYMLVNFDHGQKLTPATSAVQRAPEMAVRYQSGFVSLLVVIEPEARDETFLIKYGITSYPSHLFFDADGGLIYRSQGSRTAKNSYLEDLDKAVGNAKAETLSKYKAQFEAGNRNADFLKKYLLKNDELRLFVDQELLDAYAKSLSPEQLNDLETIAFVLERGPVINGVAYQITHKSRLMIDRIYKELPLQRRTAINNALIRNSMGQAKLTKNRTMAESAAAFARNSWNNQDPKNGQYAYLGNMTSYFKSVNDTASYLKAASEYYEIYYGRLKDSVLRPYVAPSADSIAARVKKILASQRATKGKADSVQVTRRFINGSLVSVNVSDKRMQPGTNVVDSRKRIYDYARALNNAAYIFYTMGTKDPLYLSRAISWSEKTVALFPESDSYYDTLAHLYYRNSAFNAAIENQQKAVDLAKNKAKSQRTSMSKMPEMGEVVKLNYKKAVAELQKMKDRTL